MKKLTQILLMIILFSSSKVFSQASVGGGTNSSFKPPQKQTPSVPAVAAFEKYGNLPISASSGLPDINIPITVLKLKTFSWPISLSYHAGGVKPSDIATSIGLNWILNAAGVVSRSLVSSYQQGEVPRKLNLNFIDINYGTGDLCYPNNEQDVNIANDIIAGGGTTGITLFNVNSPLINAKFLESGGTFPASNTKISFVSNGVKIADANGNLYEFMVTATNIPSSSCNSALQSYVNNSNNTSYYLSKIITYDSDTINFKYSNMSYGYNKAPLLISKRPSSANPGNNYCGPVPLTPEDITCNNSYFANDKKLDEIETSAGDIVRFFYNSRIDVPGFMRTEKIQLITKKNGSEQVLNNIHINQDYFGTGINQDDLRLKLNEVKFHDRNDVYVNSYKLYYEPGIIPSRITPDYNITENYYNGYPTITGTVNISKVGSLKRIQYPTGGETIFNYEVIQSLGRLRIKSIQDYSSENGLVNSRSYQYNEQVPVSYPGVFYKAENFYNIVQPDLAVPSAYLQICTKDYWQNEPINLSNGYEHLTSNFFASVTEYYGTKGKNGKIEYTYGFPQGNLNSSIDFIPMEPKLLSTKKYETLANGNFVLLSESTNEYQTPDISPINPYYNNYSYAYEYPTQALATSIWVKKIEMLKPQIKQQLAYSSLYFGCCPEYYQHDYRISSVPVRLTKNTERLYSKENSSTYITNTTDYFYDDLTNLGPSRVEVTDSKGDKIITKNWYPTQGAVPTGLTLNTQEQAAVNYLKDANYLSSPYYTETLLASSLISKKFNSFNIIPSGKAQLVSEKVYPKGATSFQETKILSYDLKNNPVEIQEPSGIKSSILYNMVTQKPIAVSVNNSIGQIAYSGFEVSENTGFTNLPTARTTGGISGTSSYTLSNGNIVKTGLPQGDYTVTCWGKSGIVIINGSSVNADETVNGWGLYRTIINANQVTISGTAQIDELRIHPKLAGMKTYTYGLFGVSSISDERNIINYFEYDGTGKLVRTRDKNNNILKEIEYKYIAQKANWQTTGITRCQPCSLNPTYASPIIELEEKDTNTSSDTYNQTRWIVNGETSINCGLAIWQSTSTYRCSTYVSEGQTRNTGWKERLRVDINPCSPTFNQNSWVLSHVDILGCHPPYVFAKFSKVTTSINYSESYTELIVEFFSDYECTIPVSVTNLQVKTSYTETIFNWNTGWNTTTSSPQTITCNGQSAILAADYYYYEMGQDWEDINNPNPRMTYSYDKVYFGNDGSNYDLGKFSN